jgi:hypothetical protein
VAPAVPDSLIGQRRADDPGGAVAVQPLPVCAEEYRSFGALADRQVDGPGGAGREGMATTLPPLRVMTRVRWPRSAPMCSMSAPVASETGKPFSARSETSACSARGPSPAETRSAPSSLRSRAVACDS